MHDNSFEMKIGVSLLKKTFEKLKILPIAKKNNINYIWKGIYNNYKELPDNIEPFESAKFLENTINMTNYIIERGKIMGSVNLDVKDENLLLPLLISAISKNKSKLKIIDFGGAMGISYVYVKNTISKDIDIDYHIIEKKEMCENGRLIFNGKDNHINFHSSLPFLEQVDLVHINSTLQYIENYKILLNQLCKYKPEFFVFIRFGCGDNKTFLTIQQNVEDTKIPCYFFNINEIISIMNENGYKLTFKGICSREYNMDNFPSEFRLKNSANLLFTKI